MDRLINLERKIWSKSPQIKSTQTDQRWQTQTSCDGPFNKKRPDGPYSSVTMHQCSGVLGSARECPDWPPANPAHPGDMRNTNGGRSCYWPISHEITSLGHSCTRPSFREPGSTRPAVSRRRHLHPRYSVLFQIRILVGRIRTDAGAGIGRRLGIWFIRRP